MFLLIITTIGSILAIILIPKRISSLEMYTTSFFASFLAALADFYLDVKFDYYGFFNKGIDWQYLPIFIIVYPSANIIFLNFYPYQKSLKYKILYILGFSMVTTIFEYIVLQTKIFYYNEWKLWYSAICYPFLYMLLFLNLRIIRFLSKT
jgi:hypothetical protein